MNELSAAQKNALKDLAIVGALYFGSKVVSSGIRYAIMGGVGFLLWQNYKKTQAGQAGLSGGWKMKVDPSAAVDLMFPSLGPNEKHYARLAASHILNGILPQGSDFQAGG